MTPSKDQMKAILQGLGRSAASAPATSRHAERVVWKGSTIFDPELQNPRELLAKLDLTDHAVYKRARDSGLLSAAMLRSNEEQLAAVRERQNERVREVTARRRERAKANKIAAAAAERVAREESEKRLADARDGLDPEVA